jgi:Spy/CpxP family protein refolding chaperone
MNMKNKTSLLVSALGLAMLVAGISVAATAADSPPPPTAPAPAGPHDDFRAHVADKLGLSADQQKKLDELRGKQRAELEALKADQSLAPDARRAKAMAVFENYRAQMKAVLTPEQQGKMASFREKMGQKMAQRGRGQFRGGPGGAGHGQMMQPQGHPNPMAIVAMGERIKDHLAEKLGLTNEQRDKLEHLGRDFRAQQRELAKKHMEEMRAVLTPEQQKKAEEMKQHFRHGAPGPDHRPVAEMGGAPEGLLVADLGEMPDDIPDDLPAPDQN